MFWEISGRQDLNCDPGPKRRCVYQAEALRLIKARPRGVEPYLLIVVKRSINWLRGDMVAEGGGRTRTVVTPRIFKVPVRCLFVPRNVILKIERKTGFNPRHPNLARLYLPLNYFRKTCISYFIKWRVTGVETHAKGARSKSVRCQFAHRIFIKMVSHEGLEPSTL